MKNAPKKSLVKNSIYNIIYKLMNAVFPMVTAIYVSRTLTPELVGRVSYAQNIVQYFVIIAALGIPNYGSRELAKSIQNKQKRDLLFWELLLLNAISTTVCIIAYWMIVQVIPSFRTNILLHYVVGLVLLLNYFNVDWFYYGYEEFSFIAKRNVVIKIGSLFFLFAFVRDNSDYLWYASLSGGALALNYVINFIGLRKYQIRLPEQKLKVSSHLKPIMIMLATVVAVELYTLMDTTMLGMMCPEEVVAYYTYPMQIVRVIIVVLTAIGGVLLPRLSYYFQQNMFAEAAKAVNDVFYAMLFLLLPCGIGLFMVADTLIPLLFGTVYMPAVTTLQIASLLTVALGFSNLFGTQILVAVGEERKLFFATVVGAASNIVMNACFIPVFAQNGAAVASVISESMVTLMTYMYAIKYIKIQHRKKLIWPILISSAVMVVVLWGVKMLIENSLLELVVSVGVGVIVYLVINCVMGNEWMVEGVKRIRKNRENA